jgi:hypothetical protein
VRISYLPLVKILKKGYYWRAGKSFARGMDGHAGRSVKDCAPITIYICVCNRIFPPELGGFFAAKAAAFSMSFLG